MIDISEQLSSAQGSSKIQDFDDDVEEDIEDEDTAAEAEVEAPVEEDIPAPQKVPAEKQEVPAPVEAV